MALSGKTIVFTGTLSLKRVEASAKALGAGAKVTGSVSKNTDIVVAGPDAIGTAKIVSAKAKGTTIWTEEEFKNALSKCAGSSKGKAKVERVAKQRAKASKGTTTLIMPSDKEAHAFLDLAKKRDFAQIRKIVEDNIAYVNVQPGGRWSALHQAAEQGDAETVRFLIAKGANLWARTKDGQTPRDVAKPGAKTLLTAPPKRKAAEPDPPPAKRAAGSAKPLLHLFDPTSSEKLAYVCGEWMAPDDESLCEEGVQHKHVKSAPAEARSVAEKLNKAIAGVTLPAGESDCDAVVVVISNPGTNPKEACLSALAIKKSCDESDDIWASATWESVDFKSCQSFCHEDDELEDVDDDDDIKSAIAATKILASSVKKGFHFNFDDSVVTAPQVWGGYVSDAIVGILGMRVWT